MDSDKANALIKNLACLRGRDNARARACSNEQPSDIGIPSRIKSTQAEKTEVFSCSAAPECIESLVSGMATRGKVITAEATEYMYRERSMQATFGNGK